VIFREIDALIWGGNLYWAPERSERMSGKLEAQTVVVTGAGRGIGRAIAVRCAREGAQVVLAARTDSELHETAEQIGEKNGRPLVVPTDVAVRAQVRELVAKVKSELGVVDLLVNNAGRLGALGPLWEAEPDDWWSDVTVNVYGLFLCSREFLPGMLERGRGRIINMVGGGAGSAFPFASGYAASKAAVMRLTECLDAELADVDTPVKVFALSPGFVRTAMTEPFVKTREGAKWMQRLAKRLEEGDDSPPEWAAQMAVAIGAGELDDLHGRYLNAERDRDRLDELTAKAGKIVEEDLRTLRLRR
jgi:NAD(P)-dependent dehydrogenase (short-subunit alcohol dehydrogenase family)